MPAYDSVDGGDDDSVVVGGGGDDDDDDNCSDCDNDDEDDARNYGIVSGGCFAVVAESLQLGPSMFSSPVQETSLVRHAACRLHVGYMLLAGPLRTALKNNESKCCKEALCMTMLGQCNNANTVCRRSSFLDLRSGGVLLTRQHQGTSCLTWRTA